MTYPFLMAICPHCKQPVAAGADRHVDYFDQDEEPYRATLMCCGPCQEPFVVLQTRDGDDYGKPELLWPSASKPIHQAIPPKIRREFAEARACFQAGHYTATAVMVRRVLEGVCRSHNASGSLYQALDELHTQGLLDGRLSGWAHELRVFGNDGAHFGGKKISREDAEDALILAEAVLNYMYVFTKQYEDFRQRRAGSSPAA